MAAWMTNARTFVVTVLFVAPLLGFGGLMLLALATAGYR